MLVMALWVLGCAGKDGDTGGQTGGDTAEVTEETGPTGTADSGDTSPTADSEAVDGDGDGYSASEDCDDADPESYPGATETCDGLDNDCNDLVDDDAVDAQVWYADEDEDGYGDPSESFSSCESFDDSVLNGDDCDDTDAAFSPEVSEVCGDGADNDCDGEADEFLCLGSFFLADADAQLIGEAAGDNAGYSVSDAGDFNGDGYGDVLVGAYTTNTGANYAGTAYLVLGSSERLAGEASLATADASFIGVQYADGVGWSVSSAGDLNGDGYADLALGADRATRDYTTAGLVTVILGGPEAGLGESRIDDADALLVGDIEFSHAGTSVSDAGDVDGDGYGDLLIGAALDSSNGLSAGSAYLVLGPVSGVSSLADADAKVLGEDDFDDAGISVSGAGDIDGDGFADLVIGASKESSTAVDSGAAYLLRGPSIGFIELSEADARCTGEQEEDRLGYSVSGAGDVDGDGYDDVILGATGEGSNGTFAGAIYLVTGGSTALEGCDLHVAAALLGEEGEFVGWSSSGAGDVNGDGRSDIVVGGIGRNDGELSGVGVAYLVLDTFSGRTNLADAGIVLIGEGEGEYAGWSVSGAGDLDADGMDDLLVGTLRGREGVGLTYLLYGDTL